MANSEDPDEMPHKAAFHQGLHCLLSQHLCLGKKIIIILEIITCNPLIYTMDHPNLTIAKFMENSNGLKMG